MKLQDLDDFTKAYLIAALWSSTDDEGTPLDTHCGLEDLAESTLNQAAILCDAFRYRVGEVDLVFLDKYYAENFNKEHTPDQRAGHDFWLTQHRDGVGFWDRGFGRLGERLTEISHSFPEYHLYAADGKIYME